MKRIKQILGNVQLKLMIAATVLLFGSFNAVSQEVKPSVTLDTGQIRIGEQIKLLLSVRLPAQDTIIFPTIGDTLIKEIEVISKGMIDTAFDQHEITTKILSQQVIITSFDSGYFAIPPFHFLYQSDTLETEPQLIGVQTLKTDTTQAIKDIKEPIEVEFTLLDWLKENWHWLAGSLALTGIIIALIYWLTRKKEIVQEVIIREPPKPAHVIALQKLNELQAKKLWQSGKVKQYHSELSEIIREYIEFRFRVFALEQTTEEILSSFRNAAISEALKSELRQMLMLADMVKFAKERPVASENEHSLALAFQFVNQTIPAIEEEPGKTPTDV